MRARSERLTRRLASPEPLLWVLYKPETRLPSADPLLCVRYNPWDTR